MKNAIHIRSVDAFGWRVGHMALPAGSTYRYILPQDIDRSKLPALSLWVKGRVTGVNLTTGNRVADRLPGVLTSELTAGVKAGRYELTAQEDSEWWCISAMLNGGSLPKVSSFVLFDGQSITPEKDTPLLLCAGEIEVAGKIVTPGRDVYIPEFSEIKAVGNVYGIVFDRSRQ